MIIRQETASDIDAISEVTIAAFQTLAISQHTEQYIVKALRDADALTVSLVAEFGGQVVGHVAFSPVTSVRRQPELVWPRPHFCLAAIPAPRHWQVPHP